ncbi:hypothetical protein F9C07_958 [Aspergillus flavus]|uniref:Uncharacterized protein n=1 Tax=Aspergillus flavus (strain ATCC 200026 / FGSC A1120 / IAM 13836 / NRRL 3357 / JCM 12722 / SRRC 167) TaxID=332952 RepID=A0A7U2MQH0_ASPFN|nr:hypothetical protein F9C07_958 [Aspergillus flavus]
MESGSAHTPLVLVQSKKHNMDASINGLELCESRRSSLSFGRTDDTAHTLSGSNTSLVFYDKGFQGKADLPCEKCPSHIISSGLPS